MKYTICFTAFVIATIVTVRAEIARPAECILRKVENNCGSGLGSAGRWYFSRQEIKCLHFKFNKCKKKRRYGFSTLESCERRCMTKDEINHARDKRKSNAIRRRKTKEVDKSHTIFKRSAQNPPKTGKYEMQTFPLVNHHPVLTPIKPVRPVAPIKSRGRIAPAKSSRRTNPKNRKGHKAPAKPRRRKAVKAPKKPSGRKATTKPHGVKTPMKPNSPVGVKIKPSGRNAPMKPHSVKTPMKPNSPVVVKIKPVSSINPVKSISPVDPFKGFDISGRSFTAPAGGALSEFECHLPMQDGCGQGNLTKWYFNDDNCRQFMYRGDCGNQNRFDSEEACLRKCGSKKELEAQTVKVTQKTKMEGSPKQILQTPVPMINQSPNSPAMPTSPNRTETPNKFEIPEKLKTPDTPEKPEILERPETPEKPERPETPDEKPEKPEAPEKPETPEKPERPETPEKPEAPERPETQERPETREKPESPNRQSTERLEKVESPHGSAQRSERVQKSESHQHSESHQMTKNRTEDTSKPVDYKAMLENVNHWEFPS